MNLKFLKTLGMVGMGLALAAPSFASFNYSLVEGGSSAQHGDFRQATYGPGFVPGLIQIYAGTIPGFRPANSQDTGILITTGVTLNDGETVSDAQVQIFDDTANQINGKTNIVVMLRSDSGQGVRYLFNNVKITGFPNQFVQVTGPYGGPYTFTNVSTFSTSSGDVIAKLKGDASGNGIPITTGTADVAASNVIEFGNVSNPTINVHSVNFTVASDLAVGTLLTLYNGTASGFDSHQTNFTRSQFRALISGAPHDSSGTANNPEHWVQIDPLLSDTAITACYRENASGTRLTELLDVQTGPAISVGGGTSAETTKRSVSGHDRGLVFENEFGNNAAGVAGNGGTGTMLNAVNNNAFFAGYSFVTGVAGNNKTNIRVASYDGVSPYANSGNTGGLSLPNNNGQAAYNGLNNYYVATADGQYELWTYFREYSIDNGATAAAIPALVSGDIAGVTNSLGVTLIPQMNVARASYTETNGSFTETGVQDGGIITFDATNGVLNSASKLIGILQ